MTNISLGIFWDYYVSENRHHTISRNDLLAINSLMSELTDGKARILKRVELLRIVSQENLRMIVARDMEKNVWSEPNIVGMGTVHWVDIPTKVNAYIDDVVVKKNYRGQKIGEKITKELIEIATSIDAQCIDLTSSPKREAANKLYQKLGFMKRETNVYRLHLDQNPKRDTV